MIKVILYVTLTIVSAANTFGQNSGFMPGYLVTKSYDTIHGYIKYANQFPYRILPDIKFKETEKSKNVKYTPTEIHGYKAGDKIFHSMETRDIYEPMLFMELVIDGFVKLYNYSKVTNTGGGLSNSPSIGMQSIDYLVKGVDKTLFPVSDGKFKEQLSNYFADNLELAEQIRNGDLKEKDIQLVVRNYNIWKLTH